MESRIADDITQTTTPAGSSRYVPSLCATQASSYRGDTSYRRRNNTVLTASTNDEDPVNHMFKYKRRSQKVNNLYSETEVDASSEVSSQRVRSIKSGTIPI